MKIHRKMGLFIALNVLCLAGFSQGQEARNVILMISDGAGFNAFDAASYYQYGQLGQQVYDGAGFVKYGCTTYEVESGGIQGYNPTQFWSNPAYAKMNYTDSASAATAINTGTKTYDGRINVGTGGQALTTLAQFADQYGKSTGAVSSVQMSHATPAAVWSHNASRDNYSSIANEMIYQSGLDVILGCGNPDFDNNGNPSSQSTSYVGGSTTWNALKTGATGQGWSLIQTKAEFEAIADQTAALPERLIGIPQVHKTLQQERSGSSMDPVNPFNANVPTLETMTKAAINILDQNDNGFYLMVEGGAVDWANHDNTIGRMIEEQIDFNHSVEAVVQWVENNSSWDETLLIVTADHECGMLWGANTFTGSTFNGWQPVGNNGQGVLPSVQYNSGSHTNALVPLYARGAGSELFAALVDGTDTQAGSFWNFSGQYVDNTDIFLVMDTVIPEPAAIALVSFGMVAAFRRKRRIGRTS